MNTLQFLPCYNLDDREFSFAVGKWSRHISELMALDLYNLLPNPGKNDEADPDLMFINPQSEYYDIPKLDNILCKAHGKGISLFHCNIRSLSKNFTLLIDMLYSIYSWPEIIAVTETRLNSNSISNVDLPNYNFFHVDSPTLAGGTAIYVKDTIKAIPRPELKIDLLLIESCWVEIDPCNKKKHIMIGCIYKHPSANVDEFTTVLDKFLKQLNMNKYEVYILGDMNIALLKHHTHQQTGRYLDMLYSHNLLPVTTKPTRITNHTATLIDHIYTNSVNRLISGVMPVDISDHLPIFCTVETSLKKHNYQFYLRDYSKFNPEAFLQYISAVDWDVIFAQSNNLHEATARSIDTLKLIVNKHAPLKQVSRSKQKQLKKPWISTGILKSIKTKHAMYKTHYLSNNPVKIGEFKSYSNRLNHLKNINKKAYFFKKFDLCKNNLKATWKIIGNLIKRKTKPQTTPQRIVRNNKIYTSNDDIADQFNKHFVNVGPSLASKIEDSFENPTQYILSSPANSFVMSTVTETQVLNLFMSLDKSKSSIDIPNNLIKLAAEPLSTPFTKIYNQ